MRAAARVALLLLVLELLDQLVELLNVIGADFPGFVDAIQFLLAGLVHRSHAAPAYEFQDVQFWKQRRELLDRRRRPCGLAGAIWCGRVVDGVSFQAAFKQAGWAEALGRVGGQRPAALRTGSFFFHKS